MPSDRFVLKPKLELFSRVFGSGAILALAGRAAPPQGCSANLEAVRRP